MNELIDILSDLKNKYNVIGVKASFEDEGCSFEGAKNLKEICLRAGLNLTIKIGGCGAINDIGMTKIIGAKSIIAPMIESPYALNKFINSIKTIYNKEELDQVDLYLNIETKYGFTNIEEILSNNLAKNIKGVVFGRTDLIDSLELNRIEIENETIFEILQNAINKTTRSNKIAIIGGGISVNSVDFLKRISSNLTCFETRKIIFDAKTALKNPNIEQGILKALEFEIKWLQACNNCRNNKRIESLIKKCMTYSSVL